MSRRTIIITIIVAAAAIIIATASSIIYNRISIPEAKEIAGPGKHLNVMLDNSMSEFPELKGLDRKMNAYLRRWQIKGASLAITRNDSLVYAKGYGWADEEKGELMQPGHILRMASVSKLVTAILDFSG